MVINIRDARRRRRILEMRFRQQAAWEQRLQKALDREFNTVGKEAASAFEKFGQDGIFQTIQDHEDRLKQQVPPHLFETYSFFGEELYQDAQNAGFFTTPPLGSRDVFRNGAIFYTEQVGALRVVQIAATTRNAIAKAVSTGFQDGLTTREVAKDIVKRTGGEIGLKRAGVIAQTETHSAAVTADVAAMKSLQLPFEKRWGAVHDGRTRAHHAGVDGQLRPEDGLFDVGGEQLRWPGDVRGSAENIVNCRCILTYEVD